MLPKGFEPIKELNRFDYENMTIENMVMLGYDTVRVEWPKAYLSRSRPFSIGDYLVLDGKAGVINNDGEFVKCK